MTPHIDPINVPSLKAACVHKLEGLILSGELKSGTRLPSERNLAAMLNVSRPVLHQALVDLDAKGLVEIVPRKGVFVNDFLTTGSCALLTTILSYQEGELDPAFFRGLIGMRLLMEVETARLAAIHHTAAHAGQLREILAQEAATGRQDARALAELDFAFHQTVALASDNLMYLLIINSFKSIYTNITRKFFTQHNGDSVVEETFTFHRRLVDALEARDSAAAAQIMAEMLRHGAENLE